jgi:hypothetical protein
VKENGNEHDDLQINIERFGPGPEDIDEVSQATFHHPSVREQLSETRHRLLAVQLLNSAVQGKPDSRYHQIVTGLPSTTTPTIV